MSGNKLKVAILGCGNMGSALARQLSSENSIYLYDRNRHKIEALESEGTGKACHEIQDAVKHADIVLLAVKPQNVTQIAAHLNGHLKKDQILISILGGTTLSQLQNLFSAPTVIRMMPNLAVQYGEGVIGLVDHEKMDPGTKKHLNQLFEPLGKVIWIPEEKINALTSLTGSGPAFMFVIYEAMVEAGISMGFSAHDSKELVWQMLQGSLTLLEKTHKHPGDLKWQVTSPGGTTIAGIAKLEECGLRHAVMSTFLAAYNRAKELSVEKDRD